MAKDKKINGAILWEGKSKIDGNPIVLIATGLATKSTNEKTGALVQTWILRSDVTPLEAVNTGQDESICGDCTHRGKIVDGKNVGRSCYVTIFQAPRNIFGTYKRGVYSRYKGAKGTFLLSGRNVRLGAYGDPAAIPFYVWKNLLKDSARGTGYTHLWKTCDSRFAKYCMASADSLTESKQAQTMGYRTFRVGTFAESLVKGKEFLCPASKQAGQKTNCALCLACGGKDSPNKASVFIPVHGMASKIKAYETQKKGIL